MDLKQKSSRQSEGKKSFDERKFAAEVAQKLEKLKLEIKGSRESIPEVNASLKNKSLMKFFPFRAKSSSKGKINSPLEMNLKKSSSSKLNRLFSSKKHKEASDTEVQGQLPLGLSETIFKISSRTPTLTSIQE